MSDTEKDLPPGAVFTRAEGRELLRMVRESTRLRLAAERAAQKAFAGVHPGSYAGVLDSDAEYVKASRDAIAAERLVEDWIHRRVRYTDQDYEDMIREHEDYQRAKAAQDVPRVDAPVTEVDR